MPRRQDLDHLCFLMSFSHSKLIVGSPGGSLADLGQLMTESKSSDLVPN